MDVSLRGIVIDCTDPRHLADWWHELTGWVHGEHHEDWASLRALDRTYLSFQRVPEPKAGKNRVHVDLQVEDEEAAAANAQERLGATFLWRSDDAEDPFVVLADPEGNEFCFVRNLQ